MILVDTSAWISFFRDDGKAADYVEWCLHENQAALCGPVCTELLRGFKNESERRKVWPLLRGCHYVESPDNLWSDAGEIGFRMRKKGKTIKTMDLLIASHAIAYGAPLLTLDRDFKALQAANVGLRLVKL